MPEDIPRHKRPYSTFTLTALNDLISWRYYNEARDKNITAAHTGGVSPTELARITGMTRTHIYLILKKQKDSTA